MPQRHRRCHSHSGLPDLVEDALTPHPPVPVPRCFPVVELACKPVDKFLLPTRLCERRPACLVEEAEDVFEPVDRLEFDLVLDGLRVRGQWGGGQKEHDVSRDS